MQYMLMIQYGDGPAPAGSEVSRKAWAALSKEDQKTIGVEYGALNKTPGYTPGAQLQPAEAATTIRVENGKTVATDGPAVEPAQALRGWYMVEADDLDAAIEMASRVPHARFGGAIEVRPLAGG